MDDSGKLTCPHIEHLAPPRQPPANRLVAIPHRVDPRLPTGSVPGLSTAQMFEMLGGPGRFVTGGQSSTQDAAKAQGAKADPTGAEIMAYTRSMLAMAATGNRDPNTQFYNMATLRATTQAESTVTGDPPREAMLQAWERGDLRDQVTNFISACSNPPSSIDEGATARVVLPSELHWPRALLKSADRRGGPPTASQEGPTASYSSPKSPIAPYGKCGDPTE